MTVSNEIKPLAQEANRVQDAKDILDRLVPRVIEYIDSATKEGSKVGPSETPQEIRKQVDLTLPEKGEGIDGLFESVEHVLSKSVNTWHPGFLDKLYASTNPVGVASDIILSVLNTNSHVYTVSPILTLIEKSVAKQYAGLFGFEGPRAGGLTFPGGSYSNITSMAMARAIKYPDTKTEGNGDYKFAVFASSHCHYSVKKAAILLGIGQSQVLAVDVDKEGRMIASDLETKIETAKSKGYTPLYINGTAGTTVFGSYDPFHEIAEIAKKNNLWFHIDGSWGGNVCFSDKHRYKLDGSEKADSITVNPHKMLGVPTTCSFLLVPDENAFKTANALQAPYLFHGSNDEENFDLADGTLGCGRRPDALKLYLGWQWFGTEGYGKRVDHAFELTEYLAEQVQKRPGFELVSQFPPPCLQTCFYYAPSGSLASESSANSDATRFMAKKLYDSGKFLVDYAPEQGDGGRGEFFRVVINAPTVSSHTVDDLLNEVERLGKEYVKK